MSKSLLLLLNEQTTKTMTHVLSRSNIKPEHVSLNPVFCRLGVIVQSSHSFLLCALIDYKMLFVQCVAQF